MRLNKKGFTLVEILAAIVILGILMGLAIVAVSSILSNSKEGFYDNLEDQLILAAKSYYGDHRTLLPQNIGQERQVTVETLIKNNYLKRGSVVDYGKAECNTTASYVSVIKSSKKDYIYSVYLKCPAYSIDEEKKIKDIKISVSMPYVEDISTAKATINMSVDEELDRIASYQYTIYKNDQVVYTSNNISGDNQSKITKTVKLKKYVPGVVKVVATAYDIYGNVKSDSKSESFYDEGLPECGSQSPSLDLKNNNQWINASSSTKNRKVTVKCINDETKCLSPSFSRTFSSDIDESYVTILGKNNEEVNCPVTVMIDTTKPSCGTKSHSTTWTNSNRTVSVKCSDATSGCKQSLYTEVYNNSNTKNKVVKTANITIKDKAGNSNSCAMNVYVDKQKPTCTVSGGSTSWTGGNRTVTINCKDGSGSGCKVSSFKDTVTTTTKTKTYTVEDNAGNTGTCTANIYVDKTDPKCGEITGASKDWTSSNRTIKVGCSDSHSGCVSNPTSQTFSTTTTTSSITIKDKVGNSTTCPVNVYVDKNNPTCSISKSTSSTVTSLTLTVTGNDVGSGLHSKPYSWTSSSSGFSTTRTKKVTSNGTYTAWVKDKSGRVGSCSINVNNVQAYYDINYHYNGGSNNGCANQYKVGDTTYLCTPTRANYSFAGWYTDSGLKNKITSISSSQKGDINLYAKWSAIAPSCNGVSGNTGSSWATSRTVTVKCKNPDGTSCSSKTGTYTSNGSKSLTIKGSNGATKSCSFTVSKIDSGTPSLGASGYYSSSSQAPCGGWYGGYWYQQISMTASGYRHSGSYIKVQGKKFNSGGSQKTGYGCAQFPISEFRHWRSSVRVSQSARVCNNAGRCSGEKSF